MDYDFYWDLVLQNLDVLLYGLQYTIACREQLPFVDRDALIELTSDEPWYRRAYVDTAFGEICGRWDVGVGDGSVNGPVSSSTPASLAASIRLQRPP